MTTPRPSGLPPTTKALPLRSGITNFFYGAEEGVQVDVEYLSQFDPTSGIDSVDYSKIMP